MKSICITGAVQSDLQTVANILQQAGMKQPKPIKRDNDSVDIEFWHEQVMAQAVEDFGTVQPISNPGRLWEQLASDIFVANIRSKVWGWSDTHSTWLLDYWLNFETHLNFILVCVSPQQMLANAMVSESDAISVETMMSDWQAYHQELLRFHHRNPHRSLLVDFRDCANYPEGLIERCVEQWRLPFTTPINSTYFKRSHDPLALYLAQQLCQNYSQVVSLQHELTATVTRLNGVDQVTPTLVLAPPQIIAGYRALRDRSAELQQAQAANEALAALKTQFDGVIASHARQQRDTDAKLKEFTQENELLLLQLHQVQEELEATSLKLKSQQAQVDTLTQANAALGQARDEQGKLAAERQAKIEALTQANAALKGNEKALVQEKAQRDTLQQKVNALTQTRDEQARILAERQAQLEQLNKTQANLKETTQENELLLLQLHQVQEELEATSLKLKSQQAQVDTLTQANAALGQARDEQGKLAAERQAKIEALTQANAALKGNEKALVQEKAQRDTLQQKVNALTQTRDEQARILAERQAQLEQLNKTQANLKETTQENELLLLQLHQVQEELEHHFLQHQDKQKQLQIAEARWQRLLQRNPAYFDYETIEILPAPDKDGAIAWRLTNLSVAGRHFPMLAFKTPLERGIAGLIFLRSVEDDSLLTRWPVIANQQNELILMLTGTTATLQQRAEILLDLATSDWSLLQALTALLIETLASSTILKERTDCQPEAFRAGLEKFGQILQKFPPTLRYDQVQLKREQVNPDYEHLWLHFDNLSFDGKRWPDFEFRLACANVQPGRFGFHPKLEFPEEGGQAPFDGWFVESSDDFGAKLELRFAQPDAMDMAIWLRLTEHDRIFLAALIKRLPAILGTLQSLNVQLKRPWADWIKMAREIQRIVALRTAVPPAPAPIQPAAPETNASPSKEPEQSPESLPTVKIAEKSLPRKSASKTKAVKPVMASEIHKVQE